MRAAEKAEISPFYSLARLSARCRTYVMIVLQHGVRVFCFDHDDVLDIGVYTGPHHNLWVDEADSSVADFQSGATLAEREVIL